MQILSLNILPKTVNNIIGQPVYLKRNDEDTKPTLINTSTKNAISMLSNQINNQASTSKIKQQNVQQNETLNCSRESINSILSDEDDDYLLQVPNELLNNTLSMEEKKDITQTQELMVYLNKDLKQFKTEKQNIAKKKESIQTELRCLHKQKTDFEKNIKFAQNEIAEIDKELKEMDEMINQQETKIQHLL